METDIERIQIGNAVYRMSVWQPGPDGYYREMPPLQPYEETGDVRIFYIPESTFGTESPGVTIHKVT